MGQVDSASFTRRGAVAGLALTAVPVTVLAGADNANAQAKQPTPEKSLYEN
jgi:hemoglobin